MSRLDSISDIFRKDHDDKYINKSAELAQIILSYTFVNQRLKSAISYNIPFYDRELASWLVDSDKVLMDLYHNTPYDQIKRASKVEYVLRHIKKLIDDLCKLGLVKFELVGRRSGTTDTLTLYRYTFVGYVIALLIELMQPEKRVSTSQKIYNLFASIDLRAFADPRKARFHAEILLEVLKELDPNVRLLLFHDLKLNYHEAMRREIKVLHRDFEERCVELRNQAEIVVLETKCQNCGTYYLIDWHIMHYIKRSNLDPHIPLDRVTCRECKQDNCITIPIISKKF